MEIDVVLHLVVLLTETTVVRQEKNKRLITLLDHLAEYLSILDHQEYPSQDLGQWNLIVSLVQYLPHLWHLYTVDNHLTQGQVQTVLPTVKKSQGHLLVHL
jgi:UTP:GlnB (protein PII) uridylyltransferase